MRKFGARRVLFAVAVVAVVAAFVASNVITIGGKKASFAWGAPKAIDFATQGDRGVGRITRPGRPCAAGGDGASWHYEYEAPIPAGPVVTTEAGVLGLHVDVHSDLDHDTSNPPAWLEGDESYVTLSNARGDLRLAMTDAGSCESSKATVNGSTANASGAWNVVGGSGSVRQGEGNRHVRVPRWDRAWPGQRLERRPVWRVEGSCARPRFRGQPRLLGPTRRRLRAAHRVGSREGHQQRRRVDICGQHHWGELGYAWCHLLRDEAGRDIGDLAPGESATAVLRFKLALNSPCKLLILNCPFQFGLTADAPDAFDQPTEHTDTLSTKAPDLPPPASK